MSRVIVFHGVDHKVGTTMTAQSAAEQIAFSNKEIRVLLISLQGREGMEYVRETPDTIESLKMYIDNRMIDSMNFLKACAKRENLYMLGGLPMSAQERYYHPESAAYLLEEVSIEFELILVDSGSDLNNGLTVGALEQADQRVLLLTQQETMLKRYEKLAALYGKMGFSFDSILVNKYSEEDPYDLGYISERLGAEKERVGRIRMASSWKQAEIDSRSLLEYREGPYREDLRCLSNAILRSAGLSEIVTQRKGRWRSFI